MNLIGLITALDVQRGRGKITTDDGRVAFRCPAIRTDPKLKSSLIGLMDRRIAVSIDINESWVMMNCRAMPDHQVVGQEARC